MSTPLSSMATSRILTEDRVKDVLNKHGISTPRRALISNVSELAAVDLGYPLALKVCSPRFLHKTEVAGVKLNLADWPALLAAYQEMRSRFPDEPLLVETMEKPGLEVIVGLVNDTTFGLCIMFGLGGVFAEVLQDVSFRALPIERRDAESMISELRAHRVLDGYRGQGVDREAIIDLLLRVSELGQASRGNIDQLDLNPVIVWERGLCVVDAKMVSKDESGPIVPDPKPCDPALLRPIVFPQTVAVIGASDTPGKVGNLLIKNLLAGRFAGNIYPINPRGGTVLGLTAYKSVLVVPGQIDVAVIVVPVEAAQQAIRECAEKGVKGIIIITGGYDEVGPAGHQHTDELTAILNAYPVKVMGPNLMGPVNPLGHLCAAFAIETLIPDFKPSGTGLIAQGGGVGLSFVDNATREGVGFGLYVPLGNKIDVDEADWVQFMNEDPAINVIALQIEGIKNGRKFLAALRGLTKPMVVIKTGRTGLGQRAAMSHSAALAANDRVLSGILRQYGVIRVDTTEEFYDVTKTLQYLGPITGKRMLVVTSSGALGITASDQAEQSGLELPDPPAEIKAKLRAFLPGHASLNNPVDTTLITYQPYERIAEMDILDTYDMLLLIIGDPITNIARAVKTFKDRSQKPILVTWAGGGRVEEAEHGQILDLQVPVFPSVERAMSYLRFRLPR